MYSEEDPQDFRLLASYDRTYIMAVNADYAATDFAPFKHFLLLYKNFSDDIKPLLVILCISEQGSVFVMNLIPLYEEFFKKSDHTALEHPCP